MVRLMSGIETPSYRISRGSCFCPPQFYQFSPSFRLSPGDFGKASCLQSLLMNAFSSFSNLLGKVTRLG